MITASTKSDTSTSIVNAWARLTCANIRAEVNASFRARNTSSSLDVQVK
jgi:hypothetical protein